MSAVIEVCGASKTRPDGEPLLSRIDIAIRRGESVAVIGRSGSGKSTLLAALGLLDDFNSGTYYLLGNDVGTLRDRARAELRARSIGFVFQNFSLIPHLTVRENVMIAADYSRGSARSRKRRADSLLDSLGIENLGRRRPKNLSGGEKQRAAIARALFAQPAVILADEPTGSLDIETGGIVMNEFLNVTKNHDAALVLVTHDPANTSRVDRVLSIDNGRLLPISRDDLRLQ